MLRLASSLLFKLANGLVINILRFAVLIIAARMMTKDEFGTYSYIINFAFLAVALVNLGLPTATARNLSAALFQDKDKAKAKGVLLLAAQSRLLITFIGAAIFIFLMTRLQLYQEKGNYFIWLIAVTLFFFKSFDVWFEYVFAGMQEYRLLFLGITLPRELLRLAFVGMLIWFGMSSLRLIIVDSSILAFSMLMAATLLIYQFRHITLATIDWRPFLSFAISIAPTSIIALAYERVNVVILGKYVPMSQIAEYNAAYQFTALAILLIPVGTVVVLPTFMSMGRERLNQFVNQIIRITLVLLLPIFFGLQVFGSELLSLLYGSRYASGALILGVFAFLLIERIISPTLQNVLLAFNRPKVITGVMMVGGIVNIFLAIWLVQRYGAIGPAIALVVGRFLVLTLLFIILSQDNFSFQFGKFFLITAIAASLFLFASIPAQTIIKIIVFTITLILYGFIMARFVVASDTARIITLFNRHRHSWWTLLSPPK